MIALTRENFEDDTSKLPISDLSKSHVLALIHVLLVGAKGGLALSGAELAKFLEEVPIFRFENRVYEVYGVPLDKTYLGVCERFHVQVRRLKNQEKSENQEHSSPKIVAAVPRKSEKVPQVLRVVRPSVIRLRKVFPDLSGEFTISNSVLGEVAINRHSWDRFCERFQERAEVEDEEYFRKHFILSFHRAVPAVLKPEVAVRRIINNDFVIARYFYDEEYGLRFVIHETKPIMLTVEIPR